MELTLKIVSGRNSGQEVRVPVSKFIIGRSEDCHLRPHSDLVSRHHCALLVDEGTVSLRDFNSRNGTFVNGERVVGQVALKDGDRVAVGQLVFEVHAAHGSPAQKQPKVKDVRDVAERTASGRNREDDDDVSQWLMDDTSAVASQDTRPVDSAQTVMISSAQAAEMQVAAGKSPDSKAAEAKRPGSKAAESQTAESKGEATGTATSDSKHGEKVSDSKVLDSKAGAKKGVGKLPPMPVSTTKDSREAATEMLKKILRSR